MKNQLDLVKLWFADDFNLNALEHYFQILSTIPSLEDKGDKYFDRFTKKIILASSVPTAQAFQGSLDNNPTSDIPQAENKTKVFANLLVGFKQALSKLILFGKWLSQAFLAFLLLILTAISKFVKVIVNGLKAGLLSIYRKIRKPKKYLPTTHTVRENGTVQFESDKLDPAPIEASSSNSSQGMQRTK